MALTNYLRDLSNELDSFDLGFYPRRNCHRWRPWLECVPFSDNKMLKELLEHKEDDGAVTNIGKDGFQVCMKVQQYQPNELTVKTMNNSIVIEGKHEERQDDHGFISRHFVRRYALPEGFDSKEVISTLSSDGVLTVTVPPPNKSLKSNERVIQIQQTGPAHLSIKENPKEDKAKTEN